MIVLTTPTGTIGSQVLQGLLSTAPGQIRVIARDPKRLPADLPSSVEIVLGRTDDPVVLRNALRGASALFWCQPDTPNAPDYLQAYRDWSEVAAQAIEFSKVPRVVAISGAGERPSVPAGPASALHIMEEIFSRTSASFRFLRCGNFFSNILWDWKRTSEEGVFSAGMPGDIPTPYVAVEDIARIAIDLLLDQSWGGTKGLQLLGPYDISYEDIAAELTKKLSRDVRYEPINSEIYKADCIRSGMSPSAAQGLVDIADYLQHHYKMDPKTDRSITPTSFSKWLDEKVLG